jgi:Kef-type K+ transport system membrane component KefB/nucleotide-binding universal stress UspA family protein
MHLSLILILVAQIILILALSRVMGTIFRYLHQPQVMGEMVAGIMLGPSLLGWVAPELWAHLFRPDTIPGLGIRSDPTVYLGVLSQIGVIFFLFLVGLELDPKLMQKRGHTAVVVSHVSIFAPFLLGAAVTLLLYHDLFNDAPRMSFTSVALFMGAAMSVTAFPVLARILTERNLHKTQVGAITITCAAVDDVTAWCMLAFVVGIARADGWMPGLVTAVMALIYVGFMFLLVRPFLRQLQRVHDREGRLSQNVVAVIFLLILASAWTTEAIGIHALFGAFLIGALMPKGTQFVRTLSEKLEDYTVIFLLPIFFAYTGLKTQIGLLDNIELWIATAVIVGVACLGKFGGSTLAGRACGLGWRESATIGILMNTRGLMELVILNIGLTEGVITPAVFAMMVIMALVTTAMTVPVLHLIYPHARFGAEEAAAKATEARRAFSVLVSVALPRSGGILARLAASLIGTGADAGRLVALHLRRPIDHEAYRSGLDEPERPIDLAELAPLLAESTAARVQVEPLSFVTRDAADDICAVAAAKRVDLVLMGFHKPVFGKLLLGGTVHRVLSQCESNVAVFVDRGFDRIGKVLVPYLGSRHDRLAMELADRIGRNIGAAVTVLHVIPKARGANLRALNAKGAVERAFEEPGHKTAVEFRVIEDDSPVGVVLRESRGFDLVIIGVAEEWGLESHLFGWRPERIARDCPTSMLMVRRHGS